MTVFCKSTSLVEVEVHRDVGGQSLGDVLHGLRSDSKLFTSKQRLSCCFYPIVHDKIDQIILGPPSINSIRSQSERKHIAGGMLSESSNYS